VAEALARVPVMSASISVQVQTVELALSQPAA